jgi:hypothetical protein
MELHPASCALEPKIILESAESAEEAAAFLLLLPRVCSELRITADDQNDLALLVWNAGWDALLLGATHACQVEQHIESHCSAATIASTSTLRLTNRHLYGWRTKPKEISESDCAWLEKYFSHARDLMSEEKFKNAVHCLASYHWHPSPRPRLALLWAGIEALFGIESELSFRLSLSAAKFLEPTDRDKARLLFSHVKNLYKTRSKAVHGAELKGDMQLLISDSAMLLHRLVRASIEGNALPDVESLAL